MPHSLFYSVFTVSCVIKQVAQSLYRPKVFMPLKGNDCLQSRTILAFWHSINIKITQTRLPQTLKIMKQLPTVMKVRVGIFIFVRIGLQKCIFFI